MRVALFVLALVACNNGSPPPSPEDMGVVTYDLAGLPAPRPIGGRFQEIDAQPVADPNHHDLHNDSWQWRMCPWDPRAVASVGGTIYESPDDPFAPFMAKDGYPDNCSNDDPAARVTLWRFAFGPRGCNSMPCALLWLEKELARPGDGLPDGELANAFGGLSGVDGATRTDLRTKLGDLVTAAQAFNAEAVTAYDSQGLHLAEPIAEDFTAVWFEAPDGGIATVSSGLAPVYPVVETRTP